MRRLWTSPDRADGSGGVYRRCATSLALVLALLSPALGAGAAAAADLEDLLMDLQLVPLDPRPAPDFTLESLDGKKVSLKGVRGRPTLIYFWATW